MPLSENYWKTLQKIEESTKPINQIICKDCNKYLCRKRLIIQANGAPDFLSCIFFNGSIPDLNKCPKYPN